MEERTRLFEAAGKLAGAEVVGRLEPALKKRSWLRLKSQASRTDKLLAVAALRFAGGARARALLESLSEDADASVCEKAKQAVEEQRAAAKGRDSA
jgi:hypothetical protein